MDPQVSLHEIANVTHHSPNVMIQEADVLRQAQREKAEIDRHWKQVGQSRMTLLGFKPHDKEPKPGTFLFDADGKTTHLHTDFYATVRILHEVEKHISIDPREVESEIINRSMEVEEHEREAQRQSQQHQRSSNQRPAGRGDRSR